MPGNPYGQIDMSTGGGVYIGRIILSVPRLVQSQYVEGDEEVGEETV